MNFPQAISNGFKNYGTGTGRASRSEYWYWTLFLFVGGLIAAILDQAIFHGAATDNSPAKNPINLIFRLITLVPSLAVSVRRLHDVDRKGTWLLIGLTIIGCFFPLLYWNCKKGTSGDNRFGKDPLAVTLASR